MIPGPVRNVGRSRLRAEESTAPLFHSHADSESGMLVELAAIDGACRPERRSRSAHRRPQPFSCE
jgi:hypothetical protein